MSASISGSASEGAASAEGLARRCALTNAEAALLAALVDGATLKEFATRRGVSVHTVRNQLKQLFHKTGVRRQSDLIRLALLATRQESSAS